MRRFALPGHGFVAWFSMLPWLVPTLGCEPSASKKPTALVVFAASSMTEAMREVEEQFEKAHPTLDVQLQFGGSQALRLQIEQGAPADLFVSASEDHTRALERSRMVFAKKVIAGNELVLIVPRENPAGIERFEDLTRAERIVLGAKEVPIGAYTEELFDRSREVFGDAFADAVAGKVVSREHNVRLVRAKVELGEADAAIVYRTDVIASEGGGIIMIPIPRNLRTRAEYSAAIVGRPGEVANPGEEAFLSFLRSPAGQAILVRHGFGAR